MSFGLYYLDMPKLAYDIGCLFGSDTRYMLSQGYSVICVEANPIQSAWLELDLYDEILAGRVVLIPYAIMPKKWKAKTVTLNINPDHLEWSSVGRKWEQQVDVPVIHMNEIITQYGMPELMKLDVEGCEYAILKEMKTLPQYLICELSNRKTPKMLYKKGYRFFRLSNQNLRSFWTKTFEHGEHGSGPFKDELEIPWVDIETVEKQIEILDPATFWCDIHAR